MALTAARMSISQIETVLGKALMDPAFAALLKADPASALQGLGYMPHADEVAFFTAIDTGDFTAAATKLHNTDPGHYMTEA